jgi:hypothetical protein
VPESALPSKEPTPWRRVRGVLVALALGVIATLIALEIALRFLPVNGVSGLLPVTASDPVLRLEPNNSVTRSKGPRLALPTVVRTNNVGFRNDEDYIRDPERPLLALVGDSYVVASTVPFAQTLAARLSLDAAPVGRVQSYGLRGAAFPQYLVWADFARREFQPDAFLFVIIANDFRGSFSKAPGYHHFKRNADDSSELVRIDSKRSAFQRFVQSSSLASYVVMNCGMARWGRGGKSTIPASRRFVGNIGVEASDERMENYRWGFETFLDRLPAATGVGSDRIVFAMDGMRPHMYDADELAFAETSAWAKLRAMVLELSAQRGIEVVDLHPAFVSHFERTGERLEFVEDDHWSGIGHSVATDAVVASDVYQQVFDR